ncbi:hypothetical protein OPT61_g4539 [Boeremia exigua]|uniref:Uncharacterized protein n=1 Tax=Boeremia exigua TaxID=749465 RepID=A0ACC2IDM4_9PLEO|nr:hypothetical protein OPT61_g4539 [Boeremia exigua]
MAAVARSLAYSEATSSSPSTGGVLGQPMPDQCSIVHWNDSPCRLVGVGPSSSQFNQNLVRSPPSLQDFPCSSGAAPGATPSTTSNAQDRDASAELVAGLLVAAGSLFWYQSVAIGGFLQSIEHEIVGGPSQCRIVKPLIPAMAVRRYGYLMQPLTGKDTYVGFTVWRRQGRGVNKKAGCTSSGPCRNDDG